MLEIKVNDEIRDVKGEILFGLTLFQLIMVLMGLIVGISTGFLLYFKMHAPIQAVGYISMFVTLPFGFIAWFTWHEYNAIQSIKIILSKMLTSNRKFFEYENEFFILARKQRRGNKR